MTHQKQLNVVYVWDADYPWDVRTEKVCRALTNAGHHVAIAARNKRWLPPVERLPEGTVYRMPPWQWMGTRADALLGFPAFFNPRWIGLILAAARDIQADAIIVRDVPLAPTALFAGKMLGVPVICDNAEHYPALMQALWDTGRQTPTDYLVRNPRAVELVERASMRRMAHVVVVVEEAEARLAAMGVPRSHLSLVSNTPPRSRVRLGHVHTARPGGRVDVVYLGNMEVVRGIIEAIDAIALLRARGVPARLRLIGRGRDFELLRSHARTHDLGPDAVEFLGYVESHEEALAIVGASDIGLIPHRKCALWNATIPNKLFDYMAAGLPVVSSNTDPCARILGETGAGEIFRSGDAASLADAIARLTDPGSRTRMGAAGARAILDRYNWETDAATFVSVVERIGGARRDGSCYGGDCDGVDTRTARS